MKKIVSWLLMFTLVVGLMQEMTLVAQTVTKIETDAEYTELTFADAGIEDGTFSGEASIEGISGRLPMISSLDGVAFTGKIKISDGVTSYLRIGGKNNPWYGISVEFTANSDFWGNSLSVEGDVNCRVEDPDVGLVSIDYDGDNFLSAVKVNEECTLRMEIDYVGDDVQVKIYVNGVWETTITIFDIAPYLGNCLLVYSEGSMTIASVENNGTATYVKNMITDINLGPYAVKGATIDIAGYEIPLIDIEASVKMNFGNLKIVSDSNSQTVQVLLGFDQSASANIEASKNSPKYWSDSYREVKSMYQDLTGKKVDTTRLWNKYSALRGKLKPLKANMVVDVSCDMAGYLEFELINGSLQFKEGGLMTSFSANTSLRSYYGPCYVALGIGVGANGNLAFVYENNSVNPQITVNPYFDISAGGGIGTKTTYAQIDAYGTLSADISNVSENPFTASVDIGVRWAGYIVGKEIFSGSKSFAEMQLYPDFGASVATYALIEDTDVSNVDDYYSLLNSAKTINREYLNNSQFVMPLTLDSSESVKFERSNLYPLNEPQLVTFDDDTMLLVWVDDLGVKSDENMCSLMYSYYNGSVWSSPSVIYEDGTNNDMPNVYSDGTKAYIVWQKANVEFTEDAEVEEMMKEYDLYAITFDSADMSFSSPICINSGEEETFEMYPVIYGADGAFKVAWLENTDNNIYQMSGDNQIQMASYDADGNLVDNVQVFSTSNMISEVELFEEKVYYCTVEGENSVLYDYQAEVATVVSENVLDFEVLNGVLYYSTGEFLALYEDGTVISEYAELAGIDGFKMAGNAEEKVLYTTILDENLTRSLYFSTFNEGENTWMGLEKYANETGYVRNYSPVMLSDNVTHVAMNCVEMNNGEYEIAKLFVDGKAEQVDIAVNYVDFSDEELGTGNLNLNVEVENHSSAKIESLEAVIKSEDGTALYTTEVECPMDSFETVTTTVEFAVPENYAGEQLTVQVAPVDVTDYDLSNNEVVTTLECAHVVEAEFVVTTEPSAGQNGSYSYYCEHCGEAMETVELPYLRFSGASLTLQNNLAIKYRVKKSVIDGFYENPYAVFEMAGKQTKVTSYTEDGDYYLFEFKNIAPNQMNDTIYATLYGEFNGKEYASATVEYGVATYCYNMLPKLTSDSYAKLRTLLVDLLNYGAEAQIYTDYNTDNLVNAALTEEQAAWGTQGEPELETVLNTKYATVDSPSVTWKNAILNLKDSITIQVMLATEDTTDLKVRFTDKDGKVLATVSESQFVETDGGYYVNFKGLHAGQMSEAIYITAYRDDVAVSNTVQYSIESYAYSKQNSDYLNLGDLVKAMMNYGNAAYAYSN